MASDHVSSDPVPKCSTTALEHDSLSLGPQSQENVPQAAKTVTTSNELDLLFSLMFDELLNGSTQAVSKSSAATTADVTNQRQQKYTTPSTSTTVAEDTPPLNIQTTPTSAIYEKTSPRSDLRWKPTGRIFKSVGLRWIITRKLFDSCTSKVDSEPPYGSNVDMSKIHECKQTLDLSAGTSINVQKKQSLDLSVCTLCNVNKENLRTMASDHVSSDPVPKCSTTALEHDSGPQSQENVPQAAKTVTTSNELDLLFSLMFD
nr:hypothetical protein [Tanacetum cinerariifolium]